MIRNNVSLTFLIVVPVLFLAGLTYVLKVSFATPVEFANDYQMGYRDLEKNYDQIIQKQKLFDSKYKANVVSSDKFSSKSNVIILKIEDLSQKSVENGIVTALVTRPDTSSFDVKLSQFKLENGQYVSTAFDLPKEGRWQVSLKIQINDAIRYVSFEGFVKPSN